MNQNSKQDYISPCIETDSLMLETLIALSSDDLSSGNIDSVPVDDWPPLN